MTGGDGVRETPLFLGPEGEELFAVLTEPGRADGAGAAPPVAEGTAVLVLWSGSEHPIAGKNRVRRRLAIRLAADGLPVLSVNYAGVGESAGRRRTLDLDRPFSRRSRWRRTGSRRGASGGCW